MQTDSGSDAPVTLQRRGSEVVIVLNRPDEGNRLNAATMQALAEALTSAEKDASVRAVVISGAGDYFCVGSWINGYVDGSASAQLAFARSFCSLQEIMGQLSIPIVAVVQGSCFAGGMSLLAASDMAIASEDALFGYPEVEAGLFPILAMAVAHATLPSKIALELFYSGRRMTAAEALQLNLLNRVVPAAKLWTEVESLLELLPKERTTALAFGRRIYTAMKLMNGPARLEYAQTALLTLLAQRAEQAMSERP